MAGYICALAISLFAVITGIIFMIYPLYHKHVCNEPATANVIDIHMEWRDDHWHSYPVFQYQADGKTVIIQHNVSPTYPFQVNQDNPKIFFIENQRIIMQETTWFVIGSVVLILSFLSGLLSHFTGD